MKNWPLLGGTFLVGGALEERTGVAVSSFGTSIGPAGTSLSPERTVMTPEYFAAMTIIILLLILLAALYSKGYFSPDAEAQA